MLYQQEVVLPAWVPASSEVHPLFVLFPPLPTGRFVAIGNAAGRGVFLTLGSPETRAEAAGLAREVRHLELASLPRYQSLFLGALGF